MMTLFFSTLIRPIFLAMVCLSFFVQSDCKHEHTENNSLNKQNDAKVLSNNNSNAGDVIDNPADPKGNGFFVLNYGDGKDEDNLQKFENNSSIQTKLCDSWTF